MASAESKSGNSIQVMDWTSGGVTNCTVEEAVKLSACSEVEISACLSNEPRIYKSYVFANTGIEFNKEAIVKETLGWKELPDTRCVYYQTERSAKWYVNSLMAVATLLNMDCKKVMESAKAAYPKSLKGYHIREMWEVNPKPEDIVRVGNCSHAGTPLSDKDSAFQNELVSCKDNVDVGDEVTFYTDGSTVSEQNSGAGPSAFGIYGTDNKGNVINAWGYVGDMDSNNRAELFGYVRLMEMVLEYGWKKVTVYMDSRYVLDHATISIKRWVRNGWRTQKGEPVKNKDIWERVLALQESMAKAGVVISYHWVKGHSNNFGNDAADANATRGRLAGMAGNTDPVFSIGPAPLEEESTEEDTEKKKYPPCNRLISGKRLLFTTNSSMRTQDGKYIYLTNTFEGSVEKTGRFIGKPASDNMYGVVLTQEPVGPLQALVEFQNRITPADFVQPVVGILGRIVRPDVWNMLSEYGYTHLKHSRLNICTVGEERLTLYQRPPRLAYDAVDHLMVMLERLNRYRSNTLYASEAVEDITDRFYHVGGKGKISLSSDVKPTTKAVPVETVYLGKKVTVPLTFGVDMPDRNNFSGLIKQCKEIKVYLLTFDRARSGFRYSVVIKTDSDVALYTTSMANLKTV